MRTLRVTAFMLVFLGAAALASAQTDTGAPRGNVGFFGVYAAQATDGLERGHGLGGSATFFFSRLIGVEGGVRRHAFDLAGSDENAVSGGELNALLITANVVVRGASGSIHPYMSGGIVYYSNDYTVDPAVQAQLGEFNFTAVETVGNAAGFNIAGGVDFIASDSIGFFVEGRYSSATVDTSGGLRDDITEVSATTSGSQKLGIFAVNGGLRIFF
jgi:hypothetical protein